MTRRASQPPPFAAMVLAGIAAACTYTGHTPARRVARARACEDARPVVTGTDVRPVLVAFDGSPEAVEAVRTAGVLFPGRRLVIVTVWEPGLAMAAMPTADVGGVASTAPTLEQVKMVDRAQHEHAAATAEAGSRLATEAAATAEALPVADGTGVAETVAGIAEDRDAAALVVGSRGLGRVKSALLGSTTRRLLHETRRPVVVVRASE
jgi:nucleotide-binding universal stress UspA family protein